MSVSKSQKLSCRCWDGTMHNSLSLHLLTARCHFHSYGGYNTTTSIHVHVTAFLCRVACRENEPARDYLCLMSSLHNPCCAWIKITLSCSYSAILTLGSWGYLHSHPLYMYIQHVHVPLENSFVHIHIYTCTVVLSLVCRCIYYTQTTMHSVHRLL